MSKRVTCGDCGRVLVPGDEPGPTGMCLPCMVRSIHGARLQVGISDEELRETGRVCEEILRQREAANTHIHEGRPVPWNCSPVKLSGFRA